MDIFCRGFLQFMAQGKDLTGNNIIYRAILSDNEITIYGTELPHGLYAHK
jgi:hypothetical protein